MNSNEVWRHEIYNFFWNIFSTCEQKQIKALSSYTFHHLNVNLEGNNKYYTIDMANIHTCATCGKIFRRKYDLRRHENTVHSEDTSSGEDEDSKSEDSESENEEQSEVETSESETSSTSRRRWCNCFSGPCFAPSPMQTASPDLALIGTLDDVDVFYEVKFRAQRRWCTGL